jgi:hypothetical protein
MPQEYAAPVAVAALGVAAIALLLSVWLALRLRAVGGRRSTAQPTDALSLQAAVAAELERLARLEGRVDSLTERGRGAVQHIGVVRFNPFEDTGGNQSFALALLDDRANGIVVSSLHSRQATRLYLKLITDGRSETALSAEENEALRRARTG